MYMDGLQGTTCLEAGAYLLNYACCHQCQSKEIIGERERKREEDEDGEELITFKRTFLPVHVCTYVVCSAFC